MPGLAAVKHTDSAAGLRQPPSDAEADDAGADDDCLRPMDRKNDRFVNDGLPSPGMPGQVQCVCSQPPVRALRAAGRHPSLGCNFRPSPRSCKDFLLLGWAEGSFIPTERRKFELLN